MPYFSPFSSRKPLLNLPSPQWIAYALGIRVSMRAHPNQTFAAVPSWRSSEIQHSIRINVRFLSFAPFLPSMFSAHVSGLQFGKPSSIIALDATGVWSVKSMVDLDDESDDIYPEKWPSNISSWLRRHQSA